MADLAQMKAEAARQGAQAPPDYPGGPDAWVQDWYANAKAAGSIPSERPANYAGPQDAEAQGYNYSAGVTGGSGWQPGQGITPAQLRQLSREQGWSEDFNRFSDAQLQTWINQSWDPSSGRFRSEGGGGALVEKPTDCPDGTTLHGSKCISWDQANQIFGGGYGGVAEGAYNQGGGAAPVAGPKPQQGTGDPLQDALMAMYQERGQIFGGSDAGESLGGGGIWWGSSGQSLPMAPAVQSQTAVQAIPQAQAAKQEAPAAAPGARDWTAGFSNANSSLNNALSQAPQSQQMAKEAPPQNALNDALKQTLDPNAWWKNKGDRTGIGKNNVLIA